MRHRLSGRRLSRDSEHRLSLLRNQVVSLFTYGKIKTSLQKAKETRRVAERLLTRAKEDTPHNRRIVRSFLVDRKVTNFLFEKIAPLFKDRKGGYTRILRVGFRRGDGMEMALLQLLSFPETEKKEEEKKGKTDKSKEKVTKEKVEKKKEK